MDLFQKILRSRDKPQNEMLGSAWQFYMGGSISDKSVSETNAMQITAVYVCVRILAKAVAEGFVLDYLYANGLKGCAWNKFENI